MACYNNGQTYVDTCIPAGGGTADNSTYVIDLTHYTCGNRKVCANGAYPITADLNYKVLGIPKFVGNDTYNCDILISGTVTYMPYKLGNNCGCFCPVTDNIWATISVPVSSEDIPTLTAGEVECSPTNLKDCCNITNAIQIVCSVNVATETEQG